MNQPFNQPRRTRWTDLDSRRPENMPFAEWAAEQTRRSHNEHGPWISGQDVVADFEALLRAENDRKVRQERAQDNGWTAGEPGE